MGNRTTYNEFLKILNLFSQELIDAKTLVDRVEPFLVKGPELFDWFKKFVRFEEEDIICNYFV
jgi:paired amphipathic helix protein Sin3a